SCDAVLEPPSTPYPAMSTGTFALTAFCLAFASASASCFVLEDCETFCSWPVPPHPDEQLELPPVCVAVAGSSVLLLFEASASALLRAVWSAELEPAFTSPPAMLTGTFAFTAFCFALASASASCFVFADWSTFWDWPAPPHPEEQLLLPPVWVAVAS